MKTVNGVYTSAKIFTDTDVNKKTSLWNSTAGKRNRSTMDHVWIIEKLCQSCVTKKFQGGFSCRIYSENPLTPYKYKEKHPVGELQGVSRGV